MEQNEWMEILGKQKLNDSDVLQKKTSDPVPVFRPHKDMTLKKA